MKDLGRYIAMCHDLDCAVKYNNIELAKAILEDVDCEVGPTPHMLSTCQQLGYFELYEVLKADFDLARPFS